MSSQYLISAKMNIQSYYENQAKEQINSELEMALDMDHRQEMIDEAKYWERVDKPELENDNHNWNIN